MAGGYNNQFSQYQALPTNLQNYTGGTGSPALMHQGQQHQAPGRGGVTPDFQVHRAPMQLMGGMYRPFMGGYGGFRNPFTPSPYGFMGGMGQNWGMPGGYNPMAQMMTGMPMGGHQPMDYSAAIQRARQAAAQAAAARAAAAKRRKRKPDLSDMRGNGVGGGDGGIGGGGAAAGGHGGAGPHGGGY